jgi:branched-chain amino acid transport system ATP-binding protein
MSRLELTGVSKSFGGLRVLHDVSLTAESGKITALIGPNGAGKSTLANVTSGLVPADAGTFHLGDADLTKMRAYERAREGLGRTFQNLQLFEGMSVRDNAVLGAFRHLKGNPWRSPLKHGPDGEDQGAVADAALAQLGITKLARLDVGALGFGDAKLVEPARLLAARPTALVMDEPAAGLGWDSAKKLGDWMRKFADMDVAILLIEHNMRLVMELADYIYVLDHGEMLAQGEPAQVRNDPLVLEAYLGSEDEDDE